MNDGFIEIIGAREHNLKSVTVAIPKGRLVVMSGVSGSGKSSLAFDTLFAEGQRRYIESLSAYARQFLGQLEKPRYDAMHGLTPTIAIEQKSASANPRSTVGTITEIHDYLRVLFARAGDQFCYRCGRPVARQEASQIVREILGLGHGRQIRVTILAPIARQRKGEFRDVFASLQSQGFAKVMVDGELFDLSSPPALDRNKKHDIDLVVDRLTIREGIAPRLTDSVETALNVGKGRLIALAEGEAPRIFSEHLACEVCNLSFPEPSPQLFSFNSPIGACPACNGLGTALDIDLEKVVPNPSLSLSQGAIEPWVKTMDHLGVTPEILRALARAYGIDINKPFCELPESHKRIILYGSSAIGEAHEAGRYCVPYEGVAGTLIRRLRETYSFEMRAFYQRYLTARPCDACGGRRLRPEALAVRVGGLNIAEMSEMTIARLIAFLEGMQVPAEKAPVVLELLKEILSRLKTLRDLGVGYLTLARSAASLSGGEAQRIRLASQIGSELSGVTYVLDEPSIGLHPRDNGRLIATLKRLRDIGNTVVVVEHDRDTILAADHVIEFGPGAGRNGGEIVFTGTPQELMRSERSLTGAYLSGRRRIEVPAVRRIPKGWLILRGAKGHNLQNIDVRFPLGTFTVVTGVSGAGKSTLVTETLYPAVAKALGQSATVRPLPFEALEGVEQLDKVIVIDQDPIGRTPRSNPATYTKVFDLIRAVFAATREARASGFSRSRFSFNVKGGRCERCQGAGVIRVEMHFLADVYVTCNECGGKRFNEATLRVRFKGLSISDVLNLTVDEALEVFQHHKGIRRILETLRDVGLGYLALGQPSPTLSGGEAQRIKLSRELAKVSTGRTLYVMDEPSTGLHADDVKRLLGVIDRLVSFGNTVVMIEHNPEILKVADHIIDLGPEGGEEGGTVVACGTPEEVAQCEWSHTGKVLVEYLTAARREVAA